jgi:hypothetical protein
MEPSLTSDAVSMITWCLDTQRPTQFFTGRLGLPQSDYSKTKRGRTEFYGDAAHSFKNLYNSTLDIQKTLRDRFMTGENLRYAALNQRHTLIAGVTEPLLAQYGAVI